MTARHLKIVDGNNILHANHNGAKLTVGGPTGMQVQGIFGFLKSLKAMMSKTAGDKDVIVLFDGRAQWRLDIYPEYKGNRVQSTPEDQAHYEAFKRQVPYVQKALELLGVKTLRSPLLEADDLAAHLVASVRRANEKLPPMERTFIELVSGDKDWLQLVGPDVEWFDPIRDRRCSPENFLEFTGYHTPAEFVDGKCIQGDAGDNVTGIAGMGAKSAQEFLATWHTVNNFFVECDHNGHVPKSRKSKTATSLHPEQILASPEGRAMYARNVFLMDMSHCRKPVPGEVVVTAGKGDREKFLHFCERLAFASVLREQASFLAQFPNCKPVAVATPA